jgi:hypothetical protein
MRRLAIAALVFGLGSAQAGGAFAGKILLAQTSTVTNCMMTCNAQAASCQASCVVPGNAPTGAATTTSNANVSTSCQLTCSTVQIACQSACARSSPSQ